jgi:hypothetical protein
MFHSDSSGQKLTDAQIMAGEGCLVGVDVTPPSSGYSIVTIYDSANSTTAGKKIVTELYCDAGSVGINHEYLLPVACQYGIYCTLSGTGTDAHYYVRYRLG